MQVKKTVNQFSTQSQLAFMNLVDLASFFFITEDFTQYFENL